MDKPLREQRPRIFLCHAQSDRAVVAQVAAALRETGTSVRHDIWELAPGDSIRERVDRIVQTSDLFLVFLSKASVLSRWVQAELSAALASEMKDRAITIIPVVVEQCEIPLPLASRMYVDLREDVAAGAERLARQLAVAPTVDLSQLDPDGLERLVGDLLNALGFVVSEARETGHDQGYDFSATHTSLDPFGAERTETWVVQVKAYRRQRISVAAIRELVAYLASTSSDTKGLLVTNSQLTSVARDFLSSASLQAGRQVRVIDGTELMNLLLRQANLVGRYFPPGGRQ